jgi:hypothetical protein
MSLPAVRIPAQEVSSWWVRCGSTFTPTGVDPGHADEEVEAARG